MVRLTTRQTFQFHGVVKDGSGDDNKARDRLNDRTDYHAVGKRARELNEIVIFGFPFAFYMGAQGSLIIYVLIIWYYARYMNKLDREYDVHEGDE